MCQLQQHVQHPGPPDVLQGQEPRQAACRLQLHRTPVGSLCPLPTSCLTLCCDRLQKSTYPGSSVTLDEVRDIARTHLDGAMCGHDSFGLYTGVGQGFNDFDSAIWFGEDRDGMMKLSQCTTVHTGSWTESNSKTAVWANQHL